MILQNTEAAAAAAAASSDESSEASDNEEVRRRPQPLAPDAKGSVSRLVFFPLLQQVAVEVTSDATDSVVDTTSVDTASVDSDDSDDSDEDDADEVSVNGQVSDF